MEHVAHLWDQRMQYGLRKLLRIRVIGSIYSMIGSPKFRG